VTIGGYRHCLDGPQFGLVSEIRLGLAILLAAGLGYYDRRRRAGWRWDQRSSSSRHAWTDCRVKPAD